MDLSLTFFCLYLNLEIYLYLCCILQFAVLYLKIMICGFCIYLFFTFSIMLNINIDHLNYFYINVYYIVNGNIVQITIPAIIILR